MTTQNAAFSRDANYVPITTYGLTVSKDVEFNGVSGLEGDYPVFRLNGRMFIRVFVGIPEDMTSSGSATLGLIFSVNGTPISQFLDQQQISSIGAGSFWYDNTPGVSPNNLNDVDIIGIMQDTSLSLEYRIEDAPITGGKATFYVIYTPLSEDANVEIL